MRKGEPQVESAVPTAPSFLGREGKREWNRVAKLLDAADIVTKLDRAALAMYCAAWDEYCEADKLVAEQRKLTGVGVVLQGQTGGYYINPAVNLRTSAWNKVMKAAVEFGLTPSSRSRVSVPDSRPKEKDGKGRFFKSG